MSFKNTVVEFIIKGRDLFSPAADKAAKQAEELENASKALNDELKNISGLKEQTARFNQLNKSIDGLEQSYQDASKSLVDLVAEQKQSKTALKDAESAYQNIKREVKELEASQKQAANVSKQETQALEEKRQKLNQLEVEYNKAVATNAQYNLKVKGTRTEVNQLGTTFNKSKAEIAKLEKSLESAGIDLKNLSQSSKELSQRQVAAQQAIAQNNNKLAKHKKLLNEASKEAKQFGGNIGSATKSLIAMAGAYVGIDTLKNSLFAVLNAGDKAKAFEAQMTALMGSFEAGEKATEWMRTFADDNATNIEQVQESFVSLKTFGLDPMSGSMQALVDYNAKLGGSQEKLSGIILAVGQAWAKQKLQGEEILQLLERGVPVWELLAKVTGKNSVELQKMSAAGELGRDTIKALLDELGNASNGLAAKGLERLSGQLALINNKWYEFKQTIAASGVYQVAVDFLKELNSQFEQMANNGQLDAAAQKISDFFTSIIQDGGASIKAFVENVNAFFTGIETIVGGFRIVITGFTAGVKTLGGAVTTYFQSVMQIVADTLNFFGAETWSQKAQEIANGLEAVSQGFYQSILQDGQDLNNAWAQLTQQTSEKVSQSHKDTTQVVKSTQAEQKQAIAETTDAGKKAAEELNLAMSKAGIESTQSLKDAAEQSKQLFETLLAGYKKGEVGIYEVEQAYLKWAQAGLKVAEATKKAIDPAVRAAAETNGFSEALDNLAKKSKVLDPAIQSNSDNVKRFQQQIESTKHAIIQFEAVLDDTNASMDEKARATRKLEAAQRLLKVQTESLNAVKRAEKANYYELSNIQDTYQRKLQSLNEQYRAGVLSSYEYNQRKQELNSVLQVVNGLLGDFAHLQRDATKATRDGTQATREATRADKDAAVALEQKAASLSNVSNSANRAAQSMQYYSNSGSGFGVNQNGNRTFTTYDPKVKERQEAAERMAANAQRQFDQYTAKIQAASGNTSALNKLLHEINNYLNFLSKEQEAELSALIRQQLGQANSSNRTGSTNDSSSRNQSNGSNRGSNQSDRTDSNKSGPAGGQSRQLDKLIEVLEKSPLTSANSVKLELVLPSGRSGIAFSNDRNLIDELEELQGTQ